MINSGEMKESYFINFKKLKKFNEKYPKTINGIFDCSNNNLTSLEGSPKKINGVFDCKYNNLITLKGNLKDVFGTFDCRDNHNLNNVKQQIIENQIKAFQYLTDEGDFTFEEIKIEIFNYELKNKLKKESETKLLREKEIIKKKKIIKNQNDYGFGI